MTLLAGLLAFPAQSAWAVVPTTIYESATLGPTGQMEGWGLVTTQFIGSRFYVDREIEVTAIGGHLLEWETGDLFGAIVELNSGSDLPNGSPFAGYEVVASTVFDPGYPSTDFRTPLSVTLTSGYYALIFGTDALGSSGGEGAMPYAGQSNYPLSSYILWNGMGWYNTEPSPPPRFVVEGIAGYCDVAGVCYYEYISDVVVGAINNTDSGCVDGYSDYTSLSTTMRIGTGCPITVVNGLPDPENQCGIWVDWNQDFDFDDPGETITVNGTPGTGPYTATITPPAGASIGDTRMRIRIMYTGSVSSCGYEYGEVEDYTITVVPESSLPADIVEPNGVDLRDYAILAAQWQQAPDQPSADIAPPCPDGIVDWLDLQELADNWLAGVE